jgi:tRNA modification GTPase
MFSLDDTIAAIATAAGGAARGIVRLSGANSIDVVDGCFVRENSGVKLRDVSIARVISGNIRTASLVIPTDLFLWPSRRSYTRQPLAEIHTFGSPPLLEAILQTVCRSGARLAQPGEFTLRAFLAGRIDLTQAEAVLGVIDAADRNQLQVALGQLAGGLARPLHQLRSDLLDLLADLEAGLDFVEDDIRFVAPEELSRRLAAAAKQIDNIAKQLFARGTTAGRPRVVLAGCPNVGKSSLFNALVGDAAALVSPAAGTTRDYLTARIDANGLPIELIDTAGVSNSSDGAESSHSAGIDTAAQTASAEQSRQSDLRLLCLDSTRPLNDWEQSQLAIDQTLIVLTKCDQPSGHDRLPSALATSSQTRMGLDDLLRAVEKALSAKPIDGSVVAGTAARVGESIRLAGESLARAFELATSAVSDELIAAEIRTALSELGKVVGAVYTDDLLDRVFSRFCIGK